MKRQDRRGRCKTRNGEEAGCVPPKVNTAGETKNIVPPPKKKKTGRGREKALLCLRKPSGHRLFEENKYDGKRWVRDFPTFAFIRSFTLLVLATAVGGGGLFP